MDNVVQRRLKVTLPKTIELLDDIDDAERLANVWGVNLTHCKTFREVRDRLRYHWMKKEGLMKDLEEVGISSFHRGGTFYPLEVVSRYRDSQLQVG